VKEKKIRKNKNHHNTNVLKNTSKLNRKQKIRKRNQEYIIMTLTLGLRPRQRHGKMRVNNHIHTLRNARKCKGMSPHTPKWTPTLGIGVPMDFESSDSDLKGKKSLD
jgi:hypothetical protein